MDKTAQMDKMVGADPTTRWMRSSKLVKTNVNLETLYLQGTVHEAWKDALTEGLARAGRLAQHPERRADVLPQGRPRLPPGPRELRARQIYPAQEVEEGPEEGQEEEVRLC